MLEVKEKRKRNAFRAREWGTQGGVRLQFTFSSSIGLNIKQTAMFHLKKNKTEFERPELEVHC